MRMALAVNSFTLFLNSRVMFAPSTLQDHSRIYEVLEDGNHNNSYLHRHLFQNSGMWIIRSLDLSVFRLIYFSWCTFFFNQYWFILPSYFHWTPGSPNVILCFLPSRQTQSICSVPLPFLFSPLQAFPSLSVLHHICLGSLVVFIYLFKFRQSVLGFSLMYSCIKFPH